MKARPRSVERRVAEFLSEQFATIGRAAVQRIPVLGRTGPDITINSCKIAIDVKSRVSVPNISLAPDGAIWFADGLVGFRIKNLLSYPHLDVVYIKKSKLVDDWLAHMDEWTKENRPDCTSMIVVHKPRLPIGHSTAIIYEKEMEKLWNKLQPLQ